MFYTIHNIYSGNLLDITSDLPSNQQPELMIKAWDSSIPDLYTYRWDSTQLSFVLKTCIDREITVHQFLNRFTAIERISIKEAAKTNAALSDYLDMLNSASYVDLDNHEVYGGMYYLAILGLIAQTRISEILI